MRGRGGAVLVRDEVGEDKGSHIVHRCSSELH